MGVNRRRIRSINLFTSMVTALAALLFLGTRPGRTQAPASRQTAEQVIGKYCSDCHDASARTAGIVLEPAALAHPADQAELWERVIRQLRAKSMPPVGNPRPDDAAYQQFRTSLETEL